MFIYSPLLSAEEKPAAETKAGTARTDTDSKAAAKAAAPLTLPQVDVVGDQYKITDGYATRSSSTATKTDTPLIDTPQSISVITQDVIKDQSIQSVSEAVRYVPGVTAAQGEGNRDALILRGNATTGDLFVDGIRDDVQTYRDFYNTERIEVLKGPNGMIFGRGGAGGVINRVTKEAGWDPIRELSVSYGAYNQKRTSIDFNEAISDDVAFRINGVYENSDSYRDGVNLERYGINPTLTIKATERTKIVIGAEYFKDDRVADRGVPSVNGAGNNAQGNRPFRIGDTDTFYGNARLSPTETETNAFNAMIEHVFDNGTILRNRTRYADYDKFYQNVFARSAINNAGQVQFGAYRDETERENLINQTDLIFSAHTGKIEHKLLVGMELGRQDTDNRRFSPNAANDNLPGSFTSPTFSGPISLNNLRINRSSQADILGLYVQDQIILSPKWQAIVGLRYDQFDVKHTDLTKANGDPTRKFDSNDDLISPRAGLIFKPMQNTSVYANYSQSYVPRSGDQLSGLTFANSTFDPEKFINQEVGVKWDIRPDLSLTAALFKLDREKIAAADPNNPGQTILLDGQQTKGLELGLAGRVTSKWSVFGGITLQDGEITKQQGTGAGAILKGAELQLTPDRMFSLWNRYDFNETWGAAIGVISTSDRFAATPTASQSTVLPGYTRYDAAIFAKINPRMRLQLNIENLTNKEYALYSHNNNNITPGSPITARATLIVNF
ncbi:TonB-dependent receptor [Methylobacillus flagellatus]|uniref:TonB-dependent receptor n=1 Tax=Methylobacillus flagellatus TaxID=405 RepID=UPI0025701F11|nr:TonB-dependent siderophore receptor [Methylobacillus flagellatus]